MLTLNDSWRKARELRQILKANWVDLWKTKHEDNIQAEGISKRKYEMLFVDQGEVIHATRDFKPLSFREIFEIHVGTEVSERVNVNPSEGGWGKFAKTNFQAKKVKREKPKIKPDFNQQQRKGGEGWRNMARKWRKERLNSRS